MMLQPDRSDFILYSIKEFDKREARSDCTLMKIVKSTIIKKRNMKNSRLFYLFFISSAIDYHMEY